MPRRTLRRSLALLATTLVLASTGCWTFSAPGSPNLPPLPPRLTREEAERFAASGDWPGVLIEIRKRDRAIDALVVEGDWAEDADERARLRGPRE